jgi:hypothetical protein
VKAYEAKIEIPNNKHPASPAGRQITNTSLPSGRNSNIQFPMLKICGLLGFKIFRI